MSVDSIREAIKTPNFGSKNTMYATNKPAVFIRLRDYTTREKVERLQIDLPTGTLVAMGGCGHKAPKMSTVCYAGHWGHLASRDLDHYANPIYVEAPDLSEDESS